MSTYLYTLRTSNTKKVKTQNGTLPIYHYAFSNARVEYSGYSWDETTKRNIYLATRRFYTKNEDLYFWEEKIEYTQPKTEYANGVLVTHHRTQKKYQHTMNQPIYYQSQPSVAWIDWNDKIAGIQIGRMINGKPHFTQKGASLLLEKIGVTIPTGSIID